MRISWQEGTNMGVNEWSIDVGLDVRVSKFGTLQRIIECTKVRDVIAGVNRDWKLVPSTVPGFYAIGCMRFPKHIVNAVCKELGVARPVVK